MCVGGGREEEGELGGRERVGARSWFEESFELKHQE